MSGGKLIAVWTQSISGMSCVGTLVAFYDIPGRKSGVILLFYPEHQTGQE
jgi:hypothetical protein